MRRLNLSILTVLAVCSVHAPSAFADIKLQQNVTVSASGMMSMMGSKGTMSTTVSDTKDQDITGAKFVNDDGNNS